MIVQQDQAPELLVRVAQLDHEARHPGAGRRVLRRSTGQPQGVRRHDHDPTSARRTTPTTGVLRPALVLDDADEEVPRRPHRRRVRRLQGVDVRRGTRSRAAEPEREPTWRAVSADPPPRRRRRFARLLARRPGLRLGIELLRRRSPGSLVVYVGSLAALVVTSLYRLQDDPDRPDHPTRHLARARELPVACSTTPVYREVALRTVGAAITVTLIDAVDRAPDRVLHGEGRGALGRAAMLVVASDDAALGRLPRQGLRLAGDPRPRRRRRSRRCSGTRPDSGYSTSIIVLATCGSRTWSSRSTRDSTGFRTRCSRRRPISAPRRVARSAASCCRRSGPRSSPDRSSRSALTLGDFYMNRIVGGTTEFIGNVVYRQFSVDLPFAAAYSTVPIVIMIVYLLAVATHWRARGAVAMYLSRCGSLRAARVLCPRPRRAVLARSSTSRD